MRSESLKGIQSTSFYYRRISFRNREGAVGENFRLPRQLSEPNEILKASAQNNCNSYNNEKYNQ